MKQLRKYESELREIEKVIDIHHKNLGIFKKPYQQATIDVLRTFEKLANSTINIAAKLSSFDMANGPTRDLLDALNMSMVWIFNQCNDKNTPFSIEFLESGFWKSFDLLNSYAAPYATICDAYIAYSRGKFEVSIDGNSIHFLTSKQDLKSFFNDTAETIDEIDVDNFQQKVGEIFSDSSFQEKKELFFKSVHFEDNNLVYDRTPLADFFLETARIQWESTSTLPQEWKFDRFSIFGFKKCWCELFAIALGHSLACTIYSETGCGDEINNNVVILSSSALLSHLIKQTNLEVSEVQEIVQILTYNPELRHSDIIYQPIVKLGDFYVIAPSLITSSRPERNLISVIQKTNDKEYFKRVNELEGIMRQELVSALPQDQQLFLAHDIHLKDYLPDIDLAIYDEQCNNVLICELKWLIEADSASEVYAREADINHGCEQIDKLMGYAMINRKTFMEKTFHISNTDQIDLFCCVISKHNVRSSNIHVPVISQKRFLSLVKSLPLNSVFSSIRAQNYAPDLPDGVEYTEKQVSYAGYDFFIPALKKSIFAEDELIEAFLKSIS